MGDFISIGDSLIITVFSMIVVFTGLIVLAVLISALKGMGKEKKTIINEINVVKNNEIVEKVVEEKDEYVNDDELVAVIAAAVASSLGVGISSVNIRSIRRAQQNIPVWAAVSRQEQVYRKL